MQNSILVFIGKILSRVIRLFNLGSGSTWPGHLALSINESFIEEILYKNNLQIIIIAGTNGKTTTATLIKHILESAGFFVLQNKSGANLENGLASTLIEGASMNLRVKYDYLIFESDENTLPNILKKVEPNFLILLNLFRDQLDRYGELNEIVKKWRVSISKLNSNTNLILNSDDPQVFYLSKKTSAKIHLFGLELPSKKTIIHGADSIFCPNCNARLIFEKVYYSHLGIWSCMKCGLKRKKPEVSKPTEFLEGTYNKYNVNSALLFAKLAKLNRRTADAAIKDFTPAFGRQEKIPVDKKFVQIFLSKNPTSFNESLSTIVAHNPKNLLILLNDRVPDGLDVSWIWDTDIESAIKKHMNIFVAGDRTWDMDLRLKYAGLNKIYPTENLNDAIRKALSSVKEGETLYVLPNYSAMLDLRKIIVGRKLL